MPRSRSGNQQPTLRVEALVQDERLLISCGHGQHTVAWLMEQVQERYLATKQAQSSAQVSFRQDSHWAYQHWWLEKEIAIGAGVKHMEWTVWTCDKHKRASDNTLLGYIIRYLLAPAMQLSCFGSFPGNLSNVSASRWVCILSNSKLGVDIQAASPALVIKHLRTQTGDIKLFYLQAASNFVSIVTCLTVVVWNFLGHMPGDYCGHLHAHV